MKPNMGNTDRIIRVVIGVVLLSMVFVGPQSYWGLIGLIPLITALTGWCAIYQIFGISSKHMNRKHLHHK